jgi:hypothetical protein
MILCYHVHNSVHDIHFWHKMTQKETQLYTTYGCSTFHMFVRMYPTPECWIFRPSAAVVTSRDSTRLPPTHDCGSIVSHHVAHVPEGGVFSASFGTCNRCFGHGHEIMVPLWVFMHIHCHAQSIIAPSQQNRSSMILCERFPSILPSFSVRDRNVPQPLTLPVPNLAPRSSRTSACEARPANQRGVALPYTRPPKMEAPSQEGREGVSRRRWCVFIEEQFPAT